MKLFFIFLFSNFNFFLNVFFFFLIFHLIGECCSRIHVLFSFDMVFPPGDDILHLSFVYRLGQGCVRRFYLTTKNLMSPFLFCIILYTLQIFIIIIIIIIIVYIFIVSFFKIKFIYTL